MIVGIGTDLVDVARLQSAGTRYGTRFFRRVFTSAEIVYCESRPRKYTHYAARFAAKEAAFKALGRGWPHGGLSWTEIEVLPAEGGRPDLHLYGAAEQRAHSLGVRKAHVSLSHTDETALAEVILED